jgi:hypothetical protein
MNWFGALLGLATLFIIGLGFVWVIRGERYFGYLWWPFVMAAGALSVLGSLMVESDLCSALTGILGASILWGSTELKDQAVRAELGWHPYRAAKIDPPFVEVIRKWQAPHL